MKMIREFNDKKRPIFILVVELLLAQNVVCRRDEEYPSESFKQGRVSEHVSASQEFGEKARVFREGRGCFKLAGTRQALLLQLTSKTRRFQKPGYLDTTVFGTGRIKQQAAPPSYFGQRGSICANYRGPTRH